VALPSLQFLYTWFLFNIAIIPILLYLVCCLTCVLTNKLFTDLHVEVLCEGNARRRMHIKSWKEDSRGATFLARGDRKVKYHFVKS